MLVLRIEAGKGLLLVHSSSGDPVMIGVRKVTPPNGGRPGSVELTIDDPPRRFRAIRAGRERKPAPCDDPSPSS